MSNTITVTEPSVNSLIGVWTGLQIERGVSATNLASFVVVTQIPYVLNQTSYTYTDAIGASSDWYRVVRYAPGGAFGAYSQPWPVQAPAPTTGAGARRSLKSCRRLLARKLGSLQVITTTGDGAVDGSSIVSSGLANQLDGNRYRGWWLLPTDGVSAGQIRIVPENALNAVSGEITFQPPMLSQIVKGTQVEFHKLLPPDESMGTLIGLREALNMALAECWVPDRLAFSTTGSVTYDLSTLGDWLEPSAITELYGPAFSGIPLQPFGGFAVRGDAEQVDLDVIGLATGATATVELSRPGDSYIKVGGAWTDQQSGFVNDDDECLFQPDFITTIAKAHCYEALANAATGVQWQRYRNLADDARRSANILKLRTLRHPPERSHSGYSISGDSWLSYLK